MNETKYYLNADHQAKINNNNKTRHTGFDLSVKFNEILAILVFIFIMYLQQLQDTFYLDIKKYY